MKKVSYESMIGREYNCILQGEGIKQLKNTLSLSEIINGVAIPFQEINDLLLENLDCLEYIKFWETIQIYKV